MTPDAKRKRVRRQMLGKLKVCRMEVGDVDVFTVLHRTVIGGPQRYVWCLRKSRHQPAAAIPLVG